MPRLSLRVLWVFHPLNLKNVCTQYMYYFWYACNECPGYDNDNYVLSESVRNLCNTYISMPTTAATEATVAAAMV